MRPSNRSTLAMWTAAALVLPTLLIAQWQVNPQVNRGGAPSASPGAVRYSTPRVSAGNTSFALPSQVRYQTFMSGATPSSIRMTARAIGPLAPSGAIAYVPAAPNFRSTYAPTPGNFVDTRVGPASPIASGWSPPSTGMGAVRYSPPPSYIPTPSFSSSASVSPFSAIQPSSVSGAVMLGSVKFSP